MASNPALGLDFITRREWGAVHPDGFADRPLPATLLVLHHTVTVAPDVLAPYDDDDAAVRQIERIGQSRFGGGIPYPWLITPVGRIYQGLSPHRRGAHLKGHNTEAMSVALVGNYTDTPATVAQVGAFGALVRYMTAARLLDEAKLDGGHRDFGVTACPGDRVYAELSRFRGAIVGGVPAPKPVPKTAASPNLLPPFPLPRGHYFGTTRKDARCHSGYFSTGDRAHVKRAQEALRRRGYQLVADGLYGPGTMRQVGAFQRAEGLAVDGLVGLYTWTALDNAPVRRRG